MAVQTSASDGTADQSGCEDDCSISTMLHKTKNCQYQRLEGLLEDVSRICSKAEINNNEAAQAGNIPMC